MKKFTLLFASLVMLFSMRVNAQTERIILLESFTNTGCGPCAQYNPGMDALIASNADKIAAIKYHVSWPSGNDPMYLHNTTESNARTNYYNVTGVPHVVVDGNRFNGNSGQITQAIIDQVQAIEPQMEMRLAYEVDEAANTITVNVMGKALTDISGNLRLYVGVIENEIHFTSAPGPNGERDFYSVMKKLLPSSSGMSLGTEMAAGEYFAQSFTWELANIYHMDQLDAIAWVQNQSTKDVYQACKSSQNMVPFYANEAAASEISNVKGIICSGMAEPTFLLTNFGSNTLTSAELDVFVNGEKLKTLTWSGNLPTFAAETVEIGEINFPVEEENTLEVQITSVNGSDDEAPVNNTASKLIKGAPENVAKVLKLTIRTDSNPEETTWKVTNLATGEVVVEGGPYEQANTSYNETIEITEDGCYDFTIYDAGGNGLQGTGLYGMKAGSTTLFNGKDFGFSESNEFSYEVTAAVDETSDSATSIYPNPTSGVLNIVSREEQPVTLYNMAGQRVYEGMCNGLLQIDMKAFGAGIYAVQVGGETQRVIVK